MPIARTAEEIVEDLLDRAIPNGECLECHLRPSVDRGGRERQYVSVGGRNGVKWGAPRLILHIKKGPLTNDIWALHTCDNTDDMIAKCRKIDDPEVGARRRAAMWKLIKPYYEQGLNRHEIADKLGVAPTTVWAYISERGPYFKGSVSVSPEHSSEDSVGLNNVRGS